MFAFNVHAIGKWIEPTLQIPAFLMKVKNSCSSKFVASSVQVHILTIHFRFTQFACMAYFALAFTATMCCWSETSLATCRWQTLMLTKNQQT